MTIRQPVLLALSFAMSLFTFSANLAEAGNCGSDSDCAGYGRCSNGMCGSCGADSDCTGHGRCSSGKCGACGADSDCNGGRCSGGHCGACGADSDCKGNGRCSNGRCGGCGADSDCSIGRCSSGHCGSCGADSDCKGGRCSSGHCSNAASALWPPAGAKLGDGCNDAGANTVRLGWQLPTAPSCPMTRDTSVDETLAMARFAAILDALGAY